MAGHGPGRTVSVAQHRLPAGHRRGEEGPDEMATATARRRRAIEHLIVTDYARTRLSRAAFDVVVDAFDLGPMALRSAEDRAWIRSAIAGPIREAVDHALDRLVDELIDELALGRPDLVARILNASPEIWPGAEPGGGPGSGPIGVPVMSQARPAGAPDGLRLWADAATGPDRETPEPAVGELGPAPVAVLR
jgi:hypothetical protein